jgi:hypothetical protein
MPTIIGVIFFFFAAYCFLLKEDGLFGLLIVASVFQAASAINIGERGIQPYYVVAVFIIARAVINRSLGAPAKARVPQAAWLLLFGAIAIASAFVLPFIFAGIPVYDPKVGIDDSLVIHRDSQHQRPQWQSSQSLYLGLLHCRVDRRRSVRVSAYGHPVPQLAHTQQSRILPMGREQ